MTTETIERSHIRNLILELMKDHKTVFFVWNKVRANLKDATDDHIAEVVQSMMDADEICVAVDEEDGVAFYECVKGDEPEDTEADYILSAKEALQAAQHEWDLLRQPRTEAETLLLRELRETAFGSSIRIDGLLEVLKSLGDVGEWWRVLEQLAAKRKLSFSRHRSGELFVELSDGYEINTVHRRLALPELRTMLQQ